MYSLRNPHNLNNAYDDSMSDDVFEDPEVTEKRRAASAAAASKSRHQNNTVGSHRGALAATITGDVADLRTTTTSGYPGYTPPIEALQLYARDDAEEYYQPDRDGAAATQRLAAATAAAEAESTKLGDEVTDTEIDGWKSYQMEETFDDTVVHKVRLHREKQISKSRFLSSTLLR